MHRLNLTIDEKLYEQTRLHSFLHKKSISQIVRESLRKHLDKNTATKSLILTAQGEEQIAKILKQNESITNKEFVKQFDL